MEIRVNTLIRWKPNGEENSSEPKTLENDFNYIAGQNEARLERVLYVDFPNNEVWAIDVYNKNAFPVFYQHQSLQNALITKCALVIVNYEPYPLIRITDEELGSDFAEYIKHRDKAWELIKPLIERNPHDLFNPDLRGPLIAEIAERTGTKKDTIYRYLKRYWQRGCVKNSLLPDWHLSGSRKEQREGDEGKEKDQSKDKAEELKPKRGRPSAETYQTGEITGRNVTPEDEEIFRIGINKYVEKGVAEDIPSAWKLIKEEYYTTGTYELTDPEDGLLEAPILLPADEIPTLGQFKYYYYKNRNRAKEVIIQFGQDEYDRNHRPVLNNSIAEAPFPGALYQIDAAIGDIYLVNDFDRSSLIGRPVIYFVSDGFSHYITGHTATLEGPNWMGAKLALEDALEQGICEALIGDNGEIKGYKANSLVDPFGIRVSNAAPFRPDWKSIVERHFRTIRNEYVKFVPGRVYKKRNLRGRDYRLDARLALHGFRRLLDKCVDHYNNTYWIKDYPLDAHMIEMNVKPIPAQLWNYGIKYLSGSPRQVNTEILRLNLLPTGKASTTRMGLDFNGLYYTCELAMQEGWFEKFEGKKTLSFRVAYESIVDRIYIKLDHGRKFETCVLTPASRRFEGKDWYEVRDYFAWKRRREKQYEADTQQSEAEYHADIKHLISVETEATEQALIKASISNSSRLSGIRANRSQIKRHERKYGPISAKSPEPKESTSSDPLDGAITNKSLIKVPAPDSYVPPAKPIEDIRAARERARNNNERSKREKNKDA